MQHTQIEQVQCFGHVLNLVVQDALGHISECITTLHELLKKVKNSSQKLELLRKLYSSSDISEVKPLIDVITRWNSTYKMIMQAIKLQKVRIFYSDIFQRKSLI